MDQGVLWARELFGPGSSLGQGALWARGPFGPEHPFGLGALWARTPFWPRGPLAQRAPWPAGLLGLGACHYHPPSQQLSFWVNQKVVSTPYDTFFFENSYRPNRPPYTILCRNVQNTFSINLILSLIKAPTHCNFSHSSSKEKWKQFFLPTTQKNRFFYRFVSY